MAAFSLLPRNVAVATSVTEGSLSSSRTDQKLFKHLSQALAIGRPILIHLNADTTWLLSLAYPKGSAYPAGRTRYNVLIDPWLQGPQSDVAGWFSTQWHAIKSSVQTIQELEDALAELESLQSSPPTVAAEEDPSWHDSAQSSFIDAVVCSHEFTDHCHEATLREVNRKVPVFATTKAAELIKSWNHFDAVFEVSVFDANTDWHKTSRAPLPGWIGISRLMTKDDALYYHSAVMIAIQDPTQPTEAEAIIYTPHGLESASFSTLASANPSVRTLALLHGLHDVYLTMMKQLNLGAHNALKAQRMLKPRYWIGTHDEVKRGGGLVAFLLRRKQYTLDDALKKESRQKSLQKSLAEAQAGVAEFFELKSGECLLLE